MKTNQQLNKRKIPCRASFHQRITAAVIFFAIVALFTLFALAAAGEIDVDRWVDPCGFEQRYSLPCPTCRITTSMLAFSRGKVFESFYIQPAGALLCCVLGVIAFFALLTAIFGVYFDFIRRFFAEVRIKHIILALIIIIVAGWLVTLARALTAGNSG